MPFINSKITVPVTPEKKEKIKSELGKAITTLHKSETYLMVGIEDNYDLWMAGSKLDKGAYVSVSLFGNASGTDYEKMTEQICGLYERELGIPGNAVYVTYHPISDWGWNGRNFKKNDRKQNTKLYKQSKRKYHKRPDKTCKNPEHI